MQHNVTEEKVTKTPISVVMIRSSINMVGDKPVCHSETTLSLCQGSHCDIRIT